MTSSESTERLRRAALITSLQLARLSEAARRLNRTALSLSTVQAERAILFESGGVTDMKGTGQVELAWELAETAQSCAYLAEELTMFAERFSRSQIELLGSTYSVQLSLAATFHALVDLMRQKFGEENAGSPGHGVPSLSQAMAAEIRSMLGAGRATITVEYTISGENQLTIDFDSAGDTN